jgi:hypothetical protein
VPSFTFACLCWACICFANMLWRRSLFPCTLSCTRRIRAAALLPPLRAVVLSQRWLRRHPALNYARCLRSPAVHISGVYHILGVVVRRGNHDASHCLASHRWSASVYVAHHVLSRVLHVMTVLRNLLWRAGGTISHQTFEASCKWSLE